MSFNLYVLNFVGSSLVSYGLVKYILGREPGYGVLIGSAIGTLICMVFLGIK